MRPKTLQYTDWKPNDVGKRALNRSSKNQYAVVQIWTVMDTTTVLLFSDCFRELSPKDVFPNPKFSLFRVSACTLRPTHFSVVARSSVFSFETKQKCFANMLVCLGFESLLRQGPQKQVVFVPVYKFLRCPLHYFWLLALPRESVWPF